MQRHNSADFLRQYFPLKAFVPFDPRPRVIQPIDTET